MLLHLDTGRGTSAGYDVTDPDQSLAAQSSPAFRYGGLRAGSMDNDIKMTKAEASRPKVLVDKQKVSTALQELADEHRGIPQSDTARLREVLNDVEDALSAGASHSAVLNTLHNQGFTLTLSSFQSTLARLRRERRDV